MADQDFKRILIWSGWLRLAHASLGLATLVLLLTGWLIAESPSLAGNAAEVHYLAASILLFGLVLRVALFIVGKPHERLSALVPDPGEINGIREMLLFYISMGRSRLPRWFAQNPFWKLIYLAVFLALAIQIVTGALMADRAFLMGLYLPSAHQFWAEILLWFTGLHLLAVVLHDLKGKTSDISGMINGYRTLPLEQAELPRETENSVQYVSIDEIMKK